MNRFLGLSHFFLLEVKRLLLGAKFMVEVDVTDNCNLRCKHCYHFHAKKSLEKKEVPLEEWEKRFSGLHNAGARFILLVGGEPALREDVLMLADKTFPFVYVITNGTIRIPKEFNHRIYISVDGSQNTNDSIRGKGTFERILKNYSGDKRVVINMTLMKGNYRDLEEVVKISKENGFNGVVCNIYTFAIGVKTPLTIKEERKEIIGELKRVKSLYPNDLLLSKPMIKWYEYPDHRDYCHWGDNALHFDVSWKKRRCFGDNADCSNCGCLAGSFQSPLRMLSHPSEMLKIGFV